MKALFFQMFRSTHGCGVPSFFARRPARGRNNHTAINSDDAVPLRKRKVVLQPKNVAEGFQMTSTISFTITGFKLLVSTECKIKRMKFGATLNAFTFFLYALACRETRDSFVQGFQL